MNHPVTDGSTAEELLDAKWMLKYYPQVTIWPYFANDRILRKNVEVATKNGHFPVQAPKGCTLLESYDTEWKEVSVSEVVIRGRELEHENKADSASNLTIPG